MNGGHHGHQQTDPAQEAIDNAPIEREFSIFGVVEEKRSRSKDNRTSCNQTRWDSASVLSKEFT
jgi:hypothetical protein